MPIVVMKSPLKVSGTRWGRSQALRLMGPWEQRAVGAKGMNTGAYAQERRRLAPWVGAACGESRSTPGKVPPRTGGACRNPRLWGCRCTKPIGLGVVQGQSRGASSRLPQTTGTCSSPYFARVSGGRHIAGVPCKRRTAAAASPMQALAQVPHRRLTRPYGACRLPALGAQWRSIAHPKQAARNVRRLAWGERSGGQWRARRPQRSAAAGEH